LWFLGENLDEDIWSDWGDDDGWRVCEKCQTGFVYDREDYHGWHEETDGYLCEVCFAAANEGNVL
jgi:hypothetical protein